MYTNQKGFAHLVPVVILVVGMVGFTGWYVFSRNNDSSDKQIVTSGTDQESELEAVSNTELETQQEQAGASGLKLGECVEFTSDTLEHGELKSHLENTEGFDVYSVTQRCDVSDGSQLVTFKRDVMKLPPVLILMPEDKSAKGRTTEFDCRALGGEGARLTLSLLEKGVITAVCHSGHVGESSDQTFEINYGTFEKKLVKDVQS